MLKNVLYFIKRKFFISGGRNPKRLLIFQELTFQAQKIINQLLKSFLHFKKWNFLATILKNFLNKFLKPQKPKLLTFLQKNLRINFSKNTLG